MIRVLTVLLLISVIGSAQCLASCTLESCRQPASSASQPDATCHRSSSPASSHDTAESCSHDPFLIGARDLSAVPDLSLTDFPVTAEQSVATVLFSDDSLPGAYPGWSPPRLSHNRSTVLRI